MHTFFWERGNYRQLANLRHTHIPIQAHALSFIHSYNYILRFCQKQNTAGAGTDAGAMTGGSESLELNTRKTSIRVKFSYTTPLFHRYVFILHCCCQLFYLYCFWWVYLKFIFVVVTTILVYFSTLLLLQYRLFWFLILFLLDQHLLYAAVSCLSNNRTTGDMKIMKCAGVVAIAKT